MKTLLLLTALCSLVTLSACKKETMQPQAAIATTPTPVKEPVTSEMTEFELFCYSAQSGAIDVSIANWSTENLKRNFSTKINKIIYRDENGTPLQTITPVGVTSAMLYGDEYPDQNWMTDPDSRWQWFSIARAPSASNYNGVCWQSVGPAPNFTVIKNCPKTQDLSPVIPGLNVNTQSGPITPGRTYSVEVITPQRTLIAECKIPEVPAQGQGINLIKVKSHPVAPGASPTPSVNPSATPILEPITSAMSRLEVICYSVRNSNLTVQVSINNWQTENGKKNFSTKVTQVQFRDEDGQALHTITPIGKPYAILKGDEYPNTLSSDDPDTRWQDFSIANPPQAANYFNVCWKSVGPAPGLTVTETCPKDVTYPSTIAGLNSGNTGAGPIRAGKKYTVEVTTPERKISASCTIPAMPVKASDIAYEKVWSN